MTGFSPNTKPLFGLKPVFWGAIFVLRLKSRSYKIFPLVGDFGLYSTGLGYHCRTVIAREFTFATQPLTLSNAAALKTVAFICGLYALLNTM
jgi:hypothetical protein